MSRRYFMGRLGNEALRHADEALHRAKREGKHRVALPLGCA